MCGKPVYGLQLSTSALPFLSRSSCRRRDCTQPPVALYIDPSVTPTGRGMKGWCTRPGRDPIPATVLSQDHFLACILPDEQDFLPMLLSLKLVIFSPLNLFTSTVPVAWTHPLTAAAMWWVLWTSYLFSEWASYELNLHRTLNPAEISGLRIIMTFLLLLLYVINLVKMLQFSHTGTIVEDGEWEDCEERVLEWWAVGKILIFQESLLALVYLHINRCFQVVERSCHLPINR